MTAAIHINKLIYSPDACRQAKQGLQDSPALLQIAEWNVAPAERVFLYGPSGSGKTSLLNLICGITTADSGEILINGTNISALGARARDRLRMQTMGVIFQQFNLLPYLSVADNIRLGHFFSSQTHSRQVETAIEQLTDRLKLPRSYLHQKAGSLSVGQQQRVAIARVLIKSPALIIADEPTSALDEDTRREFINTLIDCADLHNSTLLFVSHDHSLGIHFDRVVALDSINHVS
jgi:putative ABC transport system ATP-binding protein